jgi:hypothetical protein
VVWSPDGQSLFIIGREDQIYVALTPEFEAQLVSDEVIRYGYRDWLLTWVGGY